MACKISFLEYYLPERTIDNNEIARELGNITPEEIFKRTGVSVRHVVAPGQISSDIGVLAAEKLFRLNPGVKEKVQYLIFCSQTFDYVSPTTACVMQDRMGLPTHIGAIDVNQGCSGFIYSLSLAKGLIESGQVDHVLLITAETISKYIYPKDRSTRMLFGDGAAAVLISRSEENGIGRFSFGTDGSMYEVMQIKDGGFRNRLQSASFEEKVYDDGTISSDASFRMKGADVFSFTLREVPNIVRDILKNNAVHLDEIDHFIFHQANGFLLKMLRKKLNIPREKFIINLSDTGNTVSSSIPIALCRTMEKGLLKNGEKVLLCGFGVGVSWGGTIINI